MEVILWAVGNAGFRVDYENRRVFVDAFYQPIPRVAEPPATALWEVDRADLILVTHAHPDHFDPARTVAVARKTGAAVCGPRSVLTAVARLDPGVAVLDPELRSGAKTVEANGIRVRSFRTVHCPEHLSYLVEWGGYRFLHDGDGEDTRGFTPAVAGPLQALFMAPWRGSGWAECVRRLQPRQWFLMHLIEEEVQQHERGAYLPDLCTGTPPPARCLRPGEKFHDRAGDR